MTKKKKSATATGATGAKDTCFIIMPFGDWADFYYDNIFRPAVDNAGLTPRRADDLYRPSAIVHDIWELTQTARLLLADLTGKNPNVFYELGLAHAIAKPVILVAEKMDDVPFDLRALRVIIYDKNDPNWGTILKDKITAAAREVLASPKEAVLPTFMAVRGAHEKPTVTATEKELISLRQEMEMIKRSIAARESPYFRRPISRDEAEMRVRDYIRQGLPPDFVARRLSDMVGIPRQDAIDFVRDYIRRTDPSLFDERPSQPRVEERSAEKRVDEPSTDPKSAQQPPP
jgi:hypothetical protein